MYAFFKNSGWKGTFPIAVPISESSSLRIEDTLFEGYIPSTYGNRQHFVLSSSHNVTISMFSTKSKFVYLSLRCLPRSGSTCLVRGNVNNLTIEKRAVLHQTHLQGPLYAVGDNFQCLTLPLPVFNGTIDNFATTWGFTCSNITDTATYSTYKTKGLFIANYRNDGIGTIAQCIVKTNTNVSLICYKVSHFKKWECQSEQFLISKNPCEVIN